MAVERRTRLLRALCHALSSGTLDQSSLGPLASPAYLERHASRDAILREWEAESEIQGSGGEPLRIALAVILVGRGELQQARQLLEAQAQETRNPGHPAYVRGLAERLGIPLPERTG